MTYDLLSAPAQALPPRQLTAARLPVGSSPSRRTQGRSGPGTDVRTLARWARFVLPDAITRRINHEPGDPAGRRRTRRRVDRRRDIFHAAQTQPPAADPLRAGV